MALSHRLPSFSYASSVRSHVRSTRARFLHITAHPSSFSSTSPARQVRRSLLYHSRDPILSRPQSSPCRRYASTSSSPTGSLSSSASAPSSTLTSTDADTLMQHLTDLYATTKDEFEIAAEETEKKSTYGAEDREAAHEAFGVLKKAYEEAVSQETETAREVERRVGPRVRELEGALRGMDEMALED